MLRAAVSAPSGIAVPTRPYLCSASISVSVKFTRKQNAIHRDPQVGVALVYRACLALKPYRAEGQTCLYSSYRPEYIVDGCSSAVCVWNGLVHS